MADPPHDKFLLSTFCLVHGQRKELPDACSQQDLLATQILAGDSVMLIDAGKSQMEDCVTALCLHEAESSHPIIVLVATRSRLKVLRDQFQRNSSERQDPKGIEQLRMVPQIPNGFSIVTTRQFLELLEASEDVLREIPFLTLVFDDLYKLKSYGGNFFEAMKLKLWKMCNEAQFVITSPLWLSTEMKNLLLHAKNPLILFRDSLEAAFFSGLQLEVQLSESWVQQLQQLKDFLQQEALQKRRTLIFCYNRMEFEALQQALRKEDYLLHEGRKDLPRLQLWQQQLTGKLLLLRSHAPELLVNNVHCLIHLNMPPTWSQFRKRFEVLEMQPRPSEVKSQLHSLVLLNKQSQCLLPQLLECLQEHGQPIAEQLAAAHAQLQLTRETTLMARNCVICPVLLLHGRCQRPTCLYRHLLSVSDRNCATVPTAGLLRFQLLKICTPSHFAVRLLAQRDSELSPWQTLPMQEKYVSLQQELSSYYATPKHRVPASQPALQQICVRQLGENCYERVCVTHVSHQDSTVRVKQLDLSTVICHAKLAELLQCPLQLQQIESLALDIRLVGPVPYDGEESWQGSELQSIAELVQPGGICEASVAAALSHTIFVEKWQMEAVDYVEQLQRQCLARIDIGAKQRLMELVKEE